MSMSKELATYADVKAVLDAVVAKREPLQYKLPSFKAAHRWRHRFYYFRKLLRAQEAIRTGLKDIQLSTPYDGIQVAVVDDKGTLLLKYAEIEGVLTDSKGEPVPIAIDHHTGMVSDPDEDLLNELKSQVVKDIV